MSAKREGRLDKLHAELRWMKAVRGMTSADYAVEVRRREEELNMLDARSLARPVDAPDVSECEVAAEGPLPGDEMEDEALVEPVPEDWRLRSIWALSRLASVLAMLSQRETKNPKLKAAVLRLAFGFEDAPSGREVAGQFGVTPERVSQLLERMQKRFCLPKNHNNKSAAAVSSYRALANEGKHVA